MGRLEHSQMSVTGEIGRPSSVTESNSTHLERRQLGHKREKDMTVSLKTGSFLDAEDNENNVDLGIPGFIHGDGPFCLAYSKQNKKKKHFLRRLWASNNNDKDIDSNSNKDSEKNNGNGDVSIAKGEKKLVIEGGLVSAGWPSWLASVAGEAIDGWLPRRVESFEKLDKVGQGTYSSVYKARDVETGKTVAMKKVRFVNMDPHSVRFMAREIIILRRLDHPNVMKLECIVTSRMSSSLYLVFEYMEHDLAGLAATPGNKFTEPQIKFYMQQLFRGLEHCHSRSVLHRDIKGSNLLVDNNGILKIADFGLGTIFQVGQKQPLTSRVVTLWYRAPELLLGDTEYGIAIDLWSTSCILAELFSGKPIMPGRTEVEQMHKIFKLCGSPTPCHRHVQNFPQSALSLVDKLLSMEPEDRGTAASALNSEFFTTEPFPCDPSDLPKYSPCKELDIKLRDEEARRKRTEAVKGRGPESVRRGTSDFKGVRTLEFIEEGQSKIRAGHIEDGASGFHIDTHDVSLQNCLSQSSSMIHRNAVGTWKKSVPTRNSVDLRPQPSLMPQATKASRKTQDTATNEDPTSVRALRKTRIHCSGPLMPPGGNIEDILKEHERHIQKAVRRARLEKP
ncbi:hypothetical protein ES319_D08G275200v1 [Gossypium barbadense]|uniref:Protein kinase domain-containing protein n=1 Tax=Gossypium barbadense TaxID=3634 RepID=A0A5J5QJ00_GOSBA|nr:hypothetical protein ES319_D08G275200v1 [Gossypium barbadense]